MSHRRKSPRLTAVQQTQLWIDKRADSYDNLTEEELNELYLSWFPGGSGPISAMYTVCALLKVVAKHKGLQVPKPFEGTEQCSS